VVKDWILIGLSVWLYKAPVSALNIGGYLIAFAAVLWCAAAGLPAHMPLQGICKVMGSGSPQFVMRPGQGLKRAAERTSNEGRALVKP